MICQKNLKYTVENIFYKIKRNKFPSLFRAGLNSDKDASKVDDDVIHQKLMTDLLQHQYEHGRHIGDRNIRNKNHNNNIRKNHGNQQHQSNTRAAVVVYLPRDINFVNQFVTMLYGSWRYVYENRSTLFKNNGGGDINADINLVDLVVFAELDVLNRLPKDCKMFYTTPRASSPFSRRKDNSMSCLKVEQKYDTPSQYKNLNSYIMFLRSDISSILRDYTYVLRTDMDVFLTPNFFAYRPYTQRVVTGVGQYCHEFNRHRLKSIAKTHGLKHRGVHCVGSSWYGLTQDIVQLSKDAYNMSLYLYDREFQNGLPGLEAIDFRENPNGKWPEWYRLTATMYGSELVLNDGVPQFSMERNFERFDVPTCNPWPVKQHYQLHAYHTDCEFNKKRFMNTLTEYATGTSRRRAWIEGELLRYKEMDFTSSDDIQSMNATSYSTFIAWRSAAKYLEFRLKI